MNGHAIKELARAWAAVAHDGVSRKGAGEPYFNHVERVADEVWGWRRKAIAYLHDVIEDADDPRYMEAALLAIFPYDIICDVMMLSRLEDEDGKKEPYQMWIHRIASSGNEDVIAVKLADIKDNLHDIHDLPEMEHMERRYIKAKLILEGENE